MPNQAPDWMPSERQWVTIGIFALIVMMLWMAYVDADLWKVEVFKNLLQAVIVTGLLNMVLAFHYSANKTMQENMQVPVQPVQPTRTDTEAERPNNG